LLELENRNREAELGRGGMLGLRNSDVFVGAEELWLLLTDVVLTVWSRVGAALGTSSLGVGRRPKDWRQKAAELDLASFLFDVATQGWYSTPFTVTLYTNWGLWDGPCSKQSSKLGVPHRRLAQSSIRDETGCFPARQSIKGQFTLSKQICMYNVWENLIVAVFNSKNSSFGEGGPNFWPLTPTVKWSK